MNKPNTNGASKPAPPFKTIAISAAVALLFGVVGWVFGARQGRENLVQQQVKFEAKIMNAESELSRKRSELKVAQDQRYSMQARAALYRSAIDLDKRNFGTANAHLKEAADSLGKIESGNANTKIAKIVNLRDAITKTNINVAVDLETQRAQVLSFADQLNELMP